LISTHSQHAGFQNVPGNYNGLGHLQAHAGHHYKTNVWSPMLERDLEACYVVELVKLGFARPLMVDFWQMMMNPHEFNCALFLTINPSSTCTCCYAPGINLTAPTGTIRPQHIAFFDDEDLRDFLPTPQKRGFDPLHTCIEAMGPLFREGSGGKSFTYCKICGKWLREWKA